MILSGLKVLELSSILAGPSVGSFLAELGAQVLKIEHPAGGDPTRSWKLPDEDKGRSFSSYYASANYGKEIRKMNVFESSDFPSLLRDADVVISNMKWSSLGSLGLAPQNYKEEYPDKIIVNLLGYKNDPSRPAFDAVLQAETGWMSMNGESGGKHCKMPVALIDILAAHQMKEASLLALYEREKTGKGSFYQVYLESASISALANQASNYLMEGHVAQKMGSLHPNIAPYGEIVSTNDGVDLILAVGSDAQFERLANVFDIDLNTYKSNILRLKLRSKLHNELKVGFSKFSFEEIQDILKANKIPFGVIKSLDNVLKSKTAQEMTLSQEMEGYPSLRVSQIAFDQH
jgi:crotonobetainyl-CoA:carnitine CoA-transferase CaiB-like acyl-CoA transferase